MILTLNGKSAILRAGTSFEYTAENPLFSDTEGFSMSIALPLRGCPANREIFGHIYSGAVWPASIRYEASLLAGPVSLRGVAVITEITEAEVKIQFLQGLTANNLSDPLEDIYINQLPLTETLNWPTPNDPSRYWQPKNNAGLYEAVAIPWVNEKSGNMQNEVIRDASSPCGFSPHPDTINGRGSSLMHFLLPLTRSILNKAGYRYDLSAWEADTRLKWLLCCNTLPSAWSYGKSAAAALPHWTVAEFLKNLSDFLLCEFDIDHASKSVTMAWRSDIQSNLPAVTLKNVTRDYTMSVGELSETKCQYLGNKTLCYKTTDNKKWRYMSCDWFIDSAETHAGAEHFDTYEDLRKAAVEYSSYKTSEDLEETGHKVLYARDIDTWFILIPRASIEGKPDTNGNATYTYLPTLEPLNLFGAAKGPEFPKGEKLELQIVPVVMDDTNSTVGRVPFLSPGEYAEEDADRDPKDPIRPRALQILDSGEKETPEYFDRIYVAFYTGWTDKEYPAKSFTAPLEVTGRRTWGDIKTNPWSLSLRTPARNDNSQLPTIDPKKKTVFRFISSTIPNPRSIFFIHGKRYLCGKITTNFTDRGMEKTMKGEFYPLEDS